MNNGPRTRDYLEPILKVVVLLDVPQHPRRQHLGLVGQGVLVHEAGVGTLFATACFVIDILFIFVYCVHLYV